MLEQLTTTVQDELITQKLLPKESILNFLGRPPDASLFQSLLENQELQQTMSVVGEGERQAIIFHQPYTEVEPDRINESSGHVSPGKTSRHYLIVGQNEKLYTLRFFAQSYAYDPHFNPEGKRASFMLHDEEDLGAFLHFNVPHEKAGLEDLGEEGSYLTFAYQNNKNGVSLRGFTLKRDANFAQQIVEANVTQDNNGHSTNSV